MGTNQPYETSFISTEATIYNSILWFHVCNTVFLYVGMSSLYSYMLDYIHRTLDVNLKEILQIYKFVLWHLSDICIMPQKMIHWSIFATVINNHFMQNIYCTVQHITTFKMPSHICPYFSLYHKLFETTHLTVV